VALIYPVCEIQTTSQSEIRNPNVDFRKFSMLQLNSTAKLMLGNLLS